VWSYIEPVADAQKTLTLPRLILHFSRSISVVEIRRLDKEQGLVRFAVVERIQGSRGLENLRVSFLLSGQVPESLRQCDLQVGQKAVFFGEDEEGQSFIYFEGLWCHALLRDDSHGWRRLADIRPLYHGCFSGTVDELVVALKRLVMGQEAIVRSRPDGRGKTILVCYRMDQPERKNPVGDNQNTPPVQKAPSLEPARARKLREKELEDLHGKIRQLQILEDEESPRMRALKVELWKRQRGLEK
jgi:hypothetical protein